MRRLSIWCRIYLGLATFSVLGTLLSKSTGLDPGAIRPIAAFATLLFGVVAVYEPFAARRTLYAFAGVVTIGAVAEICGIYTGFPFGSYRYSDQWWPTVLLPGGHDYPLLLPFAWALIVGGAFAHWRLWPRLSALWMLLVGAGLATAMDFFMEPVMTRHLRYWEWLEPGPLPGGAPLSNVLGWLVVSAAAILLLIRTGIKAPERSESLWVFYGHLAMTLLLGAVLGA